MIGAAIDIRQKRLIQTRFGTETFLQDIVLIDNKFRTVVLTLWDTFVDEEGNKILQNIANKPIIWATNLKVSSFNGKSYHPYFSFFYSLLNKNYDLNIQIHQSGITLSTKVSSTFFIDADLLVVAEYKNWYCIISNFLHHKYIFL